jgi:hypothetical protein
MKKLRKTWSPKELCDCILNSSKMPIYYTNSEQLFQAYILPKYKTNALQKFKFMEKRIFSNFIAQLEPFPCH